MMRSTTTSGTKVRRGWQLLLLCVLSVGIRPALSAGADALSQAENDLFDALSKSDLEAASAALEAGASINALSPRGSQTPLMQAVLHGRTNIVAWCLENGADTTIPERDGYTPMHG